MFDWQYRFSIQLNFINLQCQGQNVYFSLFNRMENDLFIFYYYLCCYVINLQNENSIYRKGKKIMSKIKNNDFNYFLSYV